MGMNRRPSLHRECSNAAKTRDAESSISTTKKCTAPPQACSSMCRSRHLGARVASIASRADSTRRTLAEGTASWALALNNGAAHRERSSIARTIASTSSTKSEGHAIGFPGCGPAGTGMSKVAFPVKPPRKSRTLSWVPWHVRVTNMRCCIPPAGGCTMLVISYHW